MFDHLVTATGPSGSRRVRTVVITTSVVVHAAAVAALAIAAMWQADKLQLEDHGVPSAFVMPAPPPSGGSPRRAAALTPMEKQRKKAPRETVQPKVVEDPDDPIEEIQDTGTGGTGTGTGTGTGKGTEAGDTDGDGDCEAPPCGEDTTKTKKTEVEKKPPATDVITQDAAARLRVSGNDQIAAPNNVRVQMMRADQKKVIGSVKLCVGTDGRVDTAKVVKSTGYDAYDDKLLAEMRAWRYRAHQNDGEATRFCTVITLVYIMR